MIWDIMARINIINILVMFLQVTQLGKKTRPMFFHRVLNLSNTLLTSLRTIFSKVQTGISFSYELHFSQFFQSCFIYRHDYISKLKIDHFDSITFSFHGAKHRLSANSLLVPNMQILQNNTTF